MDEHKSFLASIANALFYFFRDVYIIIISSIISFVCYLMPVKNIVHSMVLFFVIDVVFGYWAARKIKKQRFSVKIIWNYTMPRMLLSIVLVVSCFLWDEVYAQEVVSTSNFVGWFISGVLICSIAENGYKITKWAIFPKIVRLLSAEIKEKTNFDINKKNKYE